MPRDVREPPAPGGAGGSDVSGSATRGDGHLTPETLTGVESGTELALLTVPHLKAVRLP